MHKKTEHPVPPGYILIAAQSDMDRTVEELRHAACAGMDTEADSLHHYFEKVCLIQLSFNGRNVVIDPLSGIQLREFFEVLSEKELIFQGADFDLRILKKSFGFRPKAPVFDTMLAAQVLGFEKIGLAAIVEKYFGVILSKTAQKADWSRRPLTENLLSYASDDTRYLEAIASRMSVRIEELGRQHWIRQCCERAVRTADYTDAEEDREPWRIKGSFKMQPRALAFLRSLWNWRDEEARRRDRPSFMILKNEDLLALAQGCADSPEALLSELPDFLKKMKPERFESLKNVILSAADIDPSQWPAQAPRTPWKDEKPYQGQLEKLMNACRERAGQLEIQPSFLAPRAALTAVAQQNPLGIEAIMQTSGLMRWQSEIVAEFLS